MSLFGWRRTKTKDEHLLYPMGVSMTGGGGYPAPAPTVDEHMQRLRENATREAQRGAAEARDMSMRAEVAEKMAAEAKAASDRAKASWERHQFAEGLTRFMEKHHPELVEEYVSWAGAVAALEEPAPDYTRAAGQATGTVVGVAQQAQNHALRQQLQSMDRQADDMLRQWGLK